MKRLLFLSSAIFLACILLSACNFVSYKKACFKKTCIQAELADTNGKRQRGLMFREKLAKDKGMLFIFDKPGRYSIWMKNMRFPLDIIWIDADKKIVDIKKSALPCKDVCVGYLPRAMTKYVLEVNSGFCDRFAIGLGEKIEF